MFGNHSPKHVEHCKQTSETDEWKSFYLRNWKSTVIFSGVQGDQISPLFPGSNLKLLIMQ